MHIQSFVTIFFYFLISLYIYRHRHVIFVAALNPAPDIVKTSNATAFFWFVCFFFFLTATLSLKIVIEQELSCVIVK